MDLDKGIGFKNPGIINFVFSGTKFKVCQPQLVGYKAYQHPVIQRKHKTTGKSKAVKRKIIS